ncbi:MAG: DUF2889 domain-containing protein [Gammaproteobacteria bacterium]|nr:DUF2889 domain-containing protein [Gammaproteobacteria bacterium]
MPLSEPDVERELHHTRRITLSGYRRRDGLYDIEGLLEDTKPFDVPNHHRETIPAGHPIHGMRLRLTVDLDLVIRGVEVASDDVPNPVCREVTTNFQRLVGLSMTPGFTRAVRERVGGREGCTHLVELVGALATAAYQTLYFEREQRDRANPDRARPHIIDTCYTLRSDGPVVARRWPQYATHPEAPDPAEAGLSEREQD